MSRNRAGHPHEFPVEPSVLESALCRSFFAQVGEEAQGFEPFQAGNFTSAIALLEHSVVNGDSKTETPDDAITNWSAQHASNG